MTDREKIAMRLISCIYGEERAATPREELRAISYRVEAEVESLIRDAAERAYKLGQDVFWHCPGCDCDGLDEAADPLPADFPLVAPKGGEK